MAAEAGVSQADQPWIKQHRVDISQHSDKENDECGLKGKSQGPSRAPRWLLVLSLCSLQAQEAPAWDW